MISRVIVKKGTYRDSITLLRLSKRVEAVKGVKAAAVVMATQLNKRVLSDLGFKGPEAQKASVDDMVVAIQATDAGSLDSAVAETEKLLSAQEAGGHSKKSVASIAEAVDANPRANLAVISVPGAYAKREALEALRLGLNVFMFSSNLSRGDEKELKQLASAKNLLMMGPDCGTAMINHTVLGFGNSVREGTIGIVSASGTGLQEASCLIHRGGLGISQAIGTGAETSQTRLRESRHSRGSQSSNETLGPM